MYSAIIGNDPQEAARRLINSEVVALPTETVYGLAGNALDSDVVIQIFKIKGRPSFDPLIVHCRDQEEAFRYAARIPSAAFRLAEKFWPGPLTLVLKSPGVIPDIVTAGLGTVALRVPSHPVFRKVLDFLSFPLAAPSANPFGYVSPTTARHVADQLGSKIGYILDGGTCQHGMESTIVGFDHGKPVILRLGAIPVRQIREMYPETQIRVMASSNPKAPGQLHQHYAPRKRVIWLNEAPEAILHDKSTAFLTFGPQEEKKFPGTSLNLSSIGDYHEAARNFYKLLREFDAGPWHTLVIHPLPANDNGLSETLNDRLMRVTASRHS
jgi:L-threonylcarbamoyladenylate synthase